MSVKVMSWVWDHSRSRKNERLVLLAIADCASDDGANAYPSMAELIRKTGLSERGVQTALTKLVTLGELFVGRNMGPRGCNRYRVVMATPADSAPPQNLHPAEPAVLQSDEVAQREAGTPQNLHPPADSAPPQNLRETPAESAPGTTPEPSEKNSSSKSSSSGKRGKRIPADFAITDPMRSWAYAEAAEVLGREPDRPKLDVWLQRWTAEFIDYWAARSGAGATKVDWPATWRNRVRAKLEQAAQQTPQPGSAVVLRDGPRPSTTDQRVAAAQALKGRFGGQA